MDNIILALPDKASNVVAIAENKDYTKCLLLYSKKNSFFFKLGFLPKAIFIIAISLIIWRVITEPVPDIISASLLLVGISVLYYGTGTIRNLINIYMAGFIAAMAVLLVWWLVFDQTGSIILYSASIQGIKFIVTSLSLEIGLTKVMGYAAVMLATLLVLMTTRDSDVVDFLSRIGMPFKYVLFLSIAMGNVEYMEQEFETVGKARFSRGGDLRNGFWPLKKLDNLIKVSEPFILAMLRRSVEMGTALEARGFSNMTRSIHIPARIHFTKKDTSFVALILLAVILIYAFNPTLMLLSRYLT